MAIDIPDLNLEDAAALIIVPPFAGLDRPSLGAHVLQSCARAKGFDVHVLYANVLLARQIGEADYSAICFASTSNLLGERFFANVAYRIAPDVHGLGRTAQTDDTRRSAKLTPPMGWQRFAEHVATADAWCDELAARVAERGFPIVGCTSTFEQTAASIALLGRIAALRPETIVIMGGANCEGAMAEGIRSLSSRIDYVFSGESEITFPEFLESVRDDRRPENRILYGSPCRAMDEIPTPDFAEYYAQLDEFLPDSTLRQSGQIWLPYESSRGCWWGEKSHCTFCGINGGGMVFREKSADRVIDELVNLLKTHPTRNVCMVDNIMPHGYFKTLIPRLAREVPGLHMFYEQKANLTFERVRALKAAGVAVIQPGIEALSTPLLKLMKKGVTAAQNIALLRYARISDLAVNWNLLYAFPGDRREWYEETVALIPSLVHLNPPTGVCHLSIDRFSPYFEQPQDFGLERVRPIPPYFDVLPADVDHSRVAYHFQADYDSGSRNQPALLEDMETAVAAWRGQWEEKEHGLPALEIVALQDDLFMLADTRGLPGASEFEFVNAAQAAVALLGRSSTPNGEVVSWALRKQVCLELDGRLVPLATASAELLQVLDSTFRGVLRDRGRLPVLLSTTADAATGSS